jgi:serine/threonine protein kinase
VLDYVEGHLTEEERARIQAHVDQCKDCYDLVMAAASGESSLGALCSAPIDVTTFSPGTLVKERYLIERFVGRGGMGEVYAAFDRLMEQRVALKTLLYTATDDPRAVRKLFAEVRNAQRVGHAQVCRINELQEHHDSGTGRVPVPFFTMEFVEGERLGVRLGHGPLPLSDVRVIALQLLDGLRAAHAKGVLHLDFKSDNVMLRNAQSDADAVIMDFGLSRAFDAEARPRSSEQLQGAGTLPYMSIEQLECRPNLGPPVDVYAFGVVLYEMLTGRLPFQGESLGAVLLKQLRERPAPPSAFVSRLSPKLDAFVLKCLSREPQQRFANAGEALTALSHIESWQINGRRGRWRPWAALVLLVSLLAVLVYLGERQEVMSNLPARPPAAAEEHGVRGPVEPTPSEQDIAANVVPPPEPHQAAHAPAATNVTPSPKPKRKRERTPASPAPPASSSPLEPASGSVEARAKWPRPGRPLPLERVPLPGEARSSPDSAR